MQLSDILCDALSTCISNQEEEGDDDGTTTRRNFDTVISLVKQGRYGKSLFDALQCSIDDDTDVRMDPLFEFKRMTETVMVSSKKLKRHIGSLRFTSLLYKMYAATSEEKLDDLFNATISNPRVLSKADCDLIKLDVFGGRYYRVLLKDRFDCSFAPDHHDAADVKTPWACIIL